MHRSAYPSVFILATTVGTALAGSLSAGAAPAGAPQKPVIRTRAPLNLTSVRPVDGGWRVEKDVVVGGRLFDTVAITERRLLDFGGGNKVAYVTTFANRDGYTDFEATVGYKAPFGGETDQPRVTFVVLGDGKELHRTEPLTAADPLEKISISIRGVKAVGLGVILENAFGPAYWCDPQFTMKPTPPKLPPPPPPPDEDKGDRILRLEPEKMSALARELADSVAKDPEFAKSRPTVAVGALMLIPAKDLAQSNADNAREDLTTALIKTNVFDMVERAQLDKLLAEHKEILSDTFDSKAVQRLGKLVGVQGIVIGSISDRGGYVLINIRLLDTATGRAKHAASIELRQ